MSRNTWLDKLQNNQDEEQRFQTAYQIMAAKYGLSSNPDDPQHFYNYRALFKETGELKPDATGHFPSKYKKEGHPNLVIKGIDTRTGEKYLSPHERYKKPEPTFETPTTQIEGRIRGMGDNAPIQSPATIGRTRGISADDIQEFPEPEETVRAIPEGWYAESKFTDMVQDLYVGLVHVGYMSKQFFHDMGTKAINQPVTEDVEVGGRYGMKDIIPMDVANERKRENILAGQRAYNATKKGYEKWLLAHPEYVPRVEYQGSFIENIKKNPTMLLDPGYIGHIVADSAAFSMGTMTITAAATMASGGNILIGMLAMFMTMYPQEAQQMFETLQENGMTEEEALRTASWSAALITGIEASSDAYVLMKMIPGLKKPTIGQAAKTITKVLTKPKHVTPLKAGAINYLKVKFEEVGEEIGQALTEDLTIRIVNKNHEVLPDVPEIAGRTWMATTGFAMVAGYQGTITQYRTNMLNIAIEAEKKKDEDALLKKKCN